MTLKDRISDDMKTAMRAKDAARLGTIRMLLAAVKQREIDERITLDDAAIVAVTDKMIKQRKDSISQFQGAGRTDLVEQEQAEVVVLLGYMPAQLSAEEVAGEVRDAIAQTGATGLADLGKVMGILKGKLAGRTDLSAVAVQVKAALAG
jgi:uncharacterized protein YqeY